MNITFNAVNEVKPATKWQGLFHKSWPAYYQWFISGGMEARKGYLTSATKLKEFMPELFPIYEQLVALAGGGDIEARFLSMYCPPAYMSGCSQMALQRENTFLIRNYDYSPAHFEAVMLKTNWLKNVIGISDCNWGLLDGINEDGLAASLAFGGSQAVGEGFGIPLIIRYILETTSTVAEAGKILQRVPVHMTYNVTLADRKGNCTTWYLAPGKEPTQASQPLATNHQEVIQWPQYAAVTATVERKNILEEMYNNPAETEATLVKHFSEPPLFNYNYIKNFGTLYTSLYRTTEKNVDLYLPGSILLQQSFENFHEKALQLTLPDAQLV